MNKERDGLLLAALPSGGSDFLANCIAQTNPQLRYAREFFCPTINWRMAERLEMDLGDTMFANAARMCRAVTVQQIDNLLNETWRTTGFTFTKENYLPFQLSQFAEFFDIVVLIRRFEDTFPPHRHRVMRWYEHFHGALNAAGSLDSWLVSKSKTPMNRATIGYFLFARQLIVAAHSINAPVLRYEQLMSQDDIEIESMLEDVPIDGFETAQRIVETRKVMPRPPGEIQTQWREARLLYDFLELKYGSLDDLLKRRPSNSHKSLSINKSSQNSSPRQSVNAG